MKGKRQIGKEEMMKWDEEVDVLVGGTGAAGCAAAVGALLNGAGKVLVAEKSKKLVGGTTRIAGGGWLWCPNNRYLKEMGVSQSEEEIVGLLKSLAYPDGTNVDANDLELMEAFAQDWPRVIETLQREKLMELRLVDVRDAEDHLVVEGLLRKKMASDPDFSRKTGINESNIVKLSGLMPSYCAEHPLDLCPSGKVLAPDGGTTSRQLEKAVKKFGPERAEIRMGTQIVDIVLENGRVVGAKIMDVKSKTVSTVRAKHGVIFGSGGYSHNKDMLEKYFGKENVPYGTCAAPTNTGDFCSIAASHGIPLSGMDRAWLKQVILPYRFPQRIGVFFINGDSFIIVDRTGKRFACEKDFYQQRGMQMFRNAERRCVFYVFDERAREKFEGPIKSLGGPIPSLGDDDCIIRGSNVAELTAGVRAKLKQVAPPGFELASDFQQSLEAQIGRFNQYAVQGRDPEFHRGDDAAQYCWHIPRADDNKYPNKTMYPIDQGKLCCVIMGLSTLDTKGGPRINRHGQVLDKQTKPIPGLYGAGNCVRSSTNFSYPASGATLSNAVLFGFNAGQHAMNLHSSKV